MTLFVVFGFKCGGCPFKLPVPPQTYQLLYNESILKGNIKQYTQSDTHQKVQCNAQRRTKDSEDWERGDTEKRKKEKKARGEDGQGSQGE